MRLKVLLGAVVSAVLLLANVGGAQAAGLAVRVLSNRANLISGGEALVAVTLPKGTNPETVKVTAGGRDVTGEFALRANGSYEGLVTGLTVGSNVLKAEAGGLSGQITIVNHPIGGPVFSGPQIEPWVCKNASAVDAQCDAPTTYTYEYKSSATGQFEPYEPSNPPADVATTTTDSGQTVPFIIRIETGYQDRDQYQIAVLFQPGKPWEPWAPQPQFDHKLLITHGASCGIEHESGSAPSVTSDTVGVPGAPAVSSSSPTTALGLGFAVMSTALDNAGHNCNLVTEAESLVMAKEHLIDHYGTLRYTIGTGCSGGSLVQQQVANAYPGIYQGILPQCSFQDAWSNGQEISDYHLTRRYFENPAGWAPGIAWTYNQIAAVEGHPNYGNAVIFDTVYWETLANPTTGCGEGVPSSEVYNPETNPGGVRCTLADYMINVFGPRPESLWGPVEKKLGHGFAGLPIDNVGVQYGLQGLMEGVITPAEFVDINSKIGGADVDLKPQPQRFAANEPALVRSYVSGAVNETNNLKNVAIIDLRGPDPGAFHDAYRSWSIRARLEAAEGHFPLNQVIWFGPAPLIGSPTYTTEALLAMDRWLSAVEGDSRNLTLQEKVEKDRPVEVHDQCSNIEGVEQVNVPGVGPVCQLPAAETRFSTPRVISGESIATDKQKCQLKPLQQSDYYPIQFTAEQWSQLQQAFPSGVCDFSRAGVSQKGTVPWQTYQDDSRGGSVIYGGRALGSAPAHSGEGWTSQAFAGWLK
jgi:Tannase-like family of unknown function (DUF6351)